MNLSTVTEDTLNRLAKALMVRHGVDYPTALAMLDNLRLNLICGKELLTSKSLQAALLTAVNTGKRAFLGGVFVSMPKDVPCLLPWPNQGTLNEVVQRLGGSSSPISLTEHSETLYLGWPTHSASDALVVHCAGWSGGISPANIPVNLNSRNDFALAGVAAGALGVANCFLRISGLRTDSVFEPQGISLWRPDLNWLSPEANGPEVEFLPKSQWMLGLGHLGQAYLWCFSFLPYQDNREVSFLLQDFDRAVVGNYATGLLCEIDNVGFHKTRICADWLEERGFSTVISERRFDAQTIRTGEEPRIAFSGFDKAEPRMLLEDAGFDLVVECALGADTSRFDRIILHTFPEGRKKPREIWKVEPSLAIDPNLVNAFKQEHDCGVVAETLARKAISSSFVGAFAGALAVSEVVRAFHDGVRCDLIQARLRNGDGAAVMLSAEDYQLRVARAGYLEIAKEKRLAA